jgi:hypothetical protein
LEVEVLPGKGDGFALVEAWGVDGEEDLDAVFFTGIIKGGK